MVDDVDVLQLKFSSSIGSPFFQASMATKNGALHLAAVADSWEAGTCKFSERWTESCPYHDQVILFVLRVHVVSLNVYHMFPFFDMIWIHLLLFAVIHVV